MNPGPAAATDVSYRVLSEGGGVLVETTRVSAMIPAGVQTPYLLVMVPADKSAFLVLSWRDPSGSHERQAFEFPRRPDVPPDEPIEIF